MGAAPVRKGAFLQPLQLSLLVGANLLASIGGGKVLSAGEGVTGLVVLGSGSLLALLVGSALGLGLLITARRFLSNWALVGLSFATVFSSLTLIALLWGDNLAHHEVSTIWKGGHHPLSQLEAWLFFLVLVIRCGLWFAGRSLRSDRAGSLRASWLAFTEMAYFLGFIVGLLVGPVSVAGQGNIISTFLLDVFLLSIVAFGDLFGGRAALVRCTPSIQQPVSEQAMSGPVFFWRLTVAFGASTIACQVVVLHVADILAQTRQSTWPTWSNLTLAAFYLGVAFAAALCAWARPTLELAGTWGGRLVIRSGRQMVRIPLVLLMTCAGILTLGGIFGIMTIAQEGKVLTPWSMVGIVSLVTVGGGAGLFEILVLALLGGIRSEGSGAVALAFGLVATAAAVALFLMILGELRFSGWVATRGVLHDPPKRCTRPQLDISFVDHREDGVMR